MKVKIKIHLNDGDILTSETDVEEGDSGVIYGENFGLGMPEKIVMVEAEIEEDTI